MPEKLFDDFFRSKLENYSSPVPTGLWEKIIDKTDKPKGFWWSNSNIILSMTALVLLTGAGYLFYTQKIQPTVTHNSTLTTNQALTKEIKTENNTEIQPSLNNEQSQKPVIQATAHTDTAYMAMPVSSEITTRSHKKSVHSIPTGFLLQDPGFNASSKSDQQESISEINGNSTGEIPEIQSENSLKKLNGTVLSIPGNVYNLNRLHNPPLNLRTVLGIGCPNVSGTPRNDWYLEVYGSPDYTMKTISGNGLSSLYLQKKDSTEKMAGGFTAGVRLSKAFGDHIMLKAGVQYAQLNEKFAQSTVNQTRTTEVIVSRTIIRPQGDTTFNDTTSITQVGYAIRKNLNTYKNIEIPLSVSYAFGETDDVWRFGITGGVIINMASWYNGITLDTSLSVVSLHDSGNKSFYTHNTRLSLMGGVSITRNLNETLDIFAEPYFRLALTGMTSTIGYSQKFNAAGLTLGIRMKLGNKQHN